MKYRINKCDEQGNIITGYEETLEGTKEECEQDYRNFHEYDGPVDIEQIEEAKTFYWKNWSAHQGHGIIFLTTRKKATLPIEGDIKVATVERWGKVEILRPDLMDDCPFDYFEDGFTFHHPTGEVHYNNYNATPVR